MTIQIPDELGSSIRSAVQSGLFASVDEAVTQAVRSLLRDLEEKSHAPIPVRTAGTELGFIGALRDDADLLDQAVEHAMSVRSGRPWRTPADE